MSLTVAQIKGRIKSVASKTNSDARLLMRIYMMDRFLERLSVSTYKDNFIIKGGILITSMVGVAMRSTMDIDACINNLNLDVKDTLKVINEISSIDVDDGITFDIKNVATIMDGFEYPGIRIELDATMGGMTTPFKIDISTRDIITPKEISYEYNLLIENRKIKLWTYNLETILAEKLQTILDRDVLNTRMRDFYDVYILMSVFSDRLNKQIFSSAFDATAKKRNSDLTDVALQIQRISTNAPILKLWSQYQKKYSYASEIAFEEVIESIRKLSEQAGII